MALRRSSPPCVRGDSPSRISIACRSRIPQSCWGSARIEDRRPPSFLRGTRTRRSGSSNRGQAGWRPSTVGCTHWDRRSSLHTRSCQRRNPAFVGEGRRVDDTVLPSKTARADQRRAGDVNASSMRDTDVLIVGAGPTGLVLALWLTRLGVRAKIVDKTAEPGTTSRALAVQARTLELYRQIGLADAVVERGRKMVAANLWVAGRKAGRAAIG